MGPEPVRASAAAEGEGDRWRADVEMSVGLQSSSRWVEGETCRAVADAVVVIVVLAVSPAAELASPPREPVVHAVAPHAPIAVPPPGHPADALLFGAAFVIDGGTLPTAGFGAEVLAGWARSRFELELVGTLLAPETATLAANPDQGAHIWLAELRGRACYDLLGGRLGLAPCVGGGGQLLVGDGFGSNDWWTATDPVGVASFGARAVGWITPHVAVRLGGEAVVPFTRPTFVIENAGNVYRSSSVAARGTLGVELHF